MASRARCASVSRFFARALAAAVMLRVCLRDVVGIVVAFTAVTVVAGMFGGAVVVSVVFALWLLTVLTPGWLASVLSVVTRVRSSLLELL